MKTITRVFCTTQFEGFHSWPDAPENVSYLRDRHRHIFHVRAETIVDHNDRQIEFITLKKEVDAVIKLLKETTDVRNWSCEHWASAILAAFCGLTRVEVSEDGENGAYVESVS